jgi:hypothetical protein
MLLKVLPSWRLELKENRPLPQEGGFLFRLVPAVLVVRLN